MNYLSWIFKLAPVAKTAYGFIIGNKIKSIVYLVAIVIANLAFWYLVDVFHFKPIRDAEKATEICKDNKNTTILVYDANIKVLSNNLTKQIQIIYDLNETIKDMDYNNSVLVSECNNKIDELKWRYEFEKVNLDDEFFYTKLPF